MRGVYPKNSALTLPTNSCVRVSLPGGGRPSAVGRVEVAIFMTASMSSFVGARGEVGVTAGGMEVEVGRDAGS